MEREVDPLIGTRNSSSMVKFEKGKLTLAIYAVMTATIVILSACLIAQSLRRDHGEKGPKCDQEKWQCDRFCAAYEVAAYDRPHLTAEYSCEDADYMFCQCDDLNDIAGVLRNNLQTRKSAPARTQNSFSLHKEQEGMTCTKRGISCNIFCNSTQPLSFECDYPHLYHCSCNASSGPGTSQDINIMANAYNQSKASTQPLRTHLDAGENLTTLALAAASTEA